MRSWEIDTRITRGLLARHILWRRDDPEGRPIYAVTMERAGDNGTTWPVQPIDGHASKAIALKVARQDLLDAVAALRAEQSFQAKGGRARAQSMTADERSASARKAAKARWGRGPRTING